MKELLEEWKLVGVGIAGVLLLALFLRIYNLTTLPVFVDEAIYIRWAQVMAFEPTLRFLPLSDGKQPLYMWVLMFVIKQFTNPLFIGRLVSVFSGLGTVLGIFTLSYLIFKNKYISLSSAFLYSLSPFAVFFDRMALADSMLSMFGIWTAVFAFLTTKFRRLDYALLAGFTLGFAALTKSPAIFIALLIPAFWLLIEWPKENKKKIFLFGKLIYLLIVTYVLAFVMYNIQRLGPNFHMLSSRTADYVNPISHFWTRPLDPLIPYLKDVFVWFWKMGTGVLMVVWLISYMVGYKKHTKQLILLTFWFSGPILVQAEFAKVFTARYIFFTLPYFFIICGFVLLGWKNKIVKYILIFSFLSFAFSSFIFNYRLLTNPQKANLPRGERSGYLEEWTAGQGISEIADYLRAEEAKNPGKQIIVGTEGYFGTLPDGLQIYLNDLPNVVIIGVGVIIEDTPESLVEAFGAGNKTYLVVNKSRFKGDPLEQNLKLLKSFPKALRLPDSRQYAIHGPQEELFFFQLEDVTI